MPARVLRRTNVTHRDAPKLALPFAALGLTGGWLTGRLTIGSSSSEQYIAWLLCLFTPAVCALLGESLRSRTQKTWVARTVLSTLTAGMVNGLVIGMFLGAVVGMVVGLVAGFFFSLPFLPAVLAVTRLGGQSFVFVARQQGGHFIASQTPVTLGDTVGNAYSVTSGLNAGDKVIVSSTQFLVNNMPVMPLGA